MVQTMSLLVLVWELLKYSENFRLSIGGTFKNQNKTFQNQKIQLYNVHNSHQERQELPHNSKGSKGNRVTSTQVKDSSGVFDAFDVHRAVTPIIRDLRDTLLESRSGSFFGHLLKNSRWKKLKLKSKKLKTQEFFWKTQYSGKFFWIIKGIWSKY